MRFRFALLEPGMCRQCSPLQVNRQPSISCRRGRHVGWTTPQGQDGEGKRICTFDLMHVTHPLWLAEKITWGGQAGKNLAA